MSRKLRNTIPSDQKKGEKFKKQKEEEEELEALTGLNALRFCKFEFAFKAFLALRIFLFMSGKSGRWWRRLVFQTADPQEIKKRRKRSER